MTDPPEHPRPMPVKRLDHVGIVVHDLEAARDFFVALGLEEAGRGTAGGDWVDHVIGMAGAQSDLVSLGIPGGPTWIELTRFRSPVSPAAEALAPNTPGLRHLAFAVDDVEQSLAAVAELGYALVGTIERHGDAYLLCSVRGPEGLLVELAQEL